LQAIFYLEDFYRQSSGTQSGPGEVSEYMRSGSYALLGKTRMVKETSINFSQHGGIDVFIKRFA